jgi:hypothetical protein
MYRDIEYVPVLDKAGAIIPMDLNDSTNDCSNPKEMEVLIYRGNNTFTLYEDDGETLSYKDGAYLKTAFTVEENGSQVKFTIAKGEGDVSVVPERRKYVLKFKDVVSGDVSVKVNGKVAKSEVAKRKGTLEITLDITPSSKVEIVIEDCEYLANRDKKKELTETISKFQMGTDFKGMLFKGVLDEDKGLPIVSEDYMGPIKEINKLYRG